MKNMTLANIAAACGGTYHGNEEDQNKEVLSITTDSRKAEPGCLFIAIRGERVDGHDFVDSVLKKTPSACCPSRSFRRRKETTFSRNPPCRPSRTLRSFTASSSLPR